VKNYAFTDYTNVTFFKSFMILEEIIQLKSGYCTAFHLTTCWSCSTFWCRRLYGVFS